MTVTESNSAIRYEEAARLARTGKYQGRTAVTEILHEVAQTHALEDYDANPERTVESMRTALTTYARRSGKQTIAQLVGRPRVLSSQKAAGDASFASVMSNLRATLRDAQKALEMDVTRAEREVRAAEATLNAAKDKLRAAKATQADKLKELAKLESLAS